MKIWIPVGLLICIVVNSGAVAQQQNSMSQSNFVTMVPVASFFGKEYIERIGYALAGAGDVNGDGFDDFMIGTFHNAVMGSDAGAAYLFLGHAYLRWELDDSVTNADARFLGQQAYDAAGYSVACNGDLNGDGIDDMIIGAPAGNDRVPYMSGRVYIVFGKREADWSFYCRLFESCNAIYEGEGNQDLAGMSVAYIGDVNGDGYDDFLVGAPFKDGSYKDEGKVYLILGRSTPWLKNDYLANSDAGFQYPLEGAETGYSVAGIGDVNDDGIPDFAIGAFGMSHVFIIFGRTDVNWGKNFELDNADLILYGNNRWVNEGVGWKVAGGGDLNGDGISDIIISATLDSDGGTQAGKVYVLFGKHGGWVNKEISLKDADASYLGEMPTDQAGWGLAIAGDVDGDGYHDFLVGTYKDDRGPVDGKAYLIKGKATGWQKNVSLSTIPDYCERHPDGIGYCVSSAGDFDQDGLGDYIISAPFNSDIQKWNGKVYLFASQQVPYHISGKVAYYQTGLAIPQTILWADEGESVKDTTDNLGQYLLGVRGKNDHSVHIKKTRGEQVGTSITSFDAALIARLAINLDVPDTINTNAADVFLDGYINMYDAANTLRFAVELPPLTNTYAGEWIFIPDSMFYDSVIADFVDQDYIGFIRGDVDVSWQSPGSGRFKVDEADSYLFAEPTIKGEEIILPIYYDVEAPLYSFDLDIEYNQRAIELSRIEPTASTSGFKMAYNNGIKNQLKIGAFNPIPIVEKTKLLSIVFKIKDHSIQQTQLAINKFLVNSYSLSTTTLNVSIANETLFPEQFELLQNYPNPFNSSTTIPYYVSQKGKVKLVIYNLLGEEITTLVDELKIPGKYEASWNGKDKFQNQVVSGVYICKVIHTSGSEKIKIIYMK